MRHITARKENLKKLKIMKSMGLFSDQKSNGLKMEKKIQNTF